MEDLFRQPAILASLVAALFASMGLAAMVFNRQWAENSGAMLAAFASGALIGAAVLHLLPESLEMSDQAIFYVFGGYLVLFTLRAYTNDPRVSDGAPWLAALAPVLAVGLHSFIDGAVYNITFSAGETTGLVTSSGLILHEFSEGVLLFILLRAAGLRTPAAALFTFIGSALTTPFGAVATYIYLTPYLNDELLGILLGASAGALLYVGGPHITQHIRGVAAWKVVVAFLLGSAISLLAVAGHFGEAGHHHHHHH